MSKRHMLEARALMEAAYEAVSAGRPRPWRACEARAAAALEAAEQRGVRAGLARAWDDCRNIPAADYRIRSIDPASVDVKD